MEEIPVETISEELSLEEFHERFLDDMDAAPTLFKGSADKHQFKLPKWTVEDLSERVGDTKVHVRYKTSCESYRQGKSYCIVQMTVKEYMQRLINGDSNANNYYLAIRNIGKLFPDIVDELQLPKYVEKKHSGPFLWVAAKGHFEFAHFDPDDNFLIPIEGRKRVRMWACADFRRMYPNPLGSLGRTIQFQAGGHPDEQFNEDYPDALGLKYWDVTVYPGDFLFIPAFTIHQVTALDTAISTNVFFGNKGTNNYISKLFREPRREAFHYWFLNIIDQNRDLPSFARLLTYAPKSIFSFFVTQFKEQLTEAQIEQLLQLVCDHIGLDRKGLTLADDFETKKNAPMLKIRGLLFRDG